MNIEILAISKLKDPSIKSLCNHYMKRIKCFSPIELREINLKTKIPNTGKLVLLDETGEHLTSQGFAKWIQETGDRGTHKLTFVIGGDSGLPPEVKENKPYLLSLSKMTLKHDLARLIFLEQLYRALTILKNHPYHRI